MRCQSGNPLVWLSLAANNIAAPFGQRFHDAFRDYRFAGRSASANPIEQVQQQKQQIQPEP